MAVIFAARCAYDRSTVRRNPVGAYECPTVKVARAAEYERVSQADHPRFGRPQESAGASSGRVSSASDDYRTIG
jgi:hypothetical protein